MKYSVIVPIYNSEKTLYYCLRSIEKQTFSDFEVLMINDGSTDKSEEICLSFIEKDKRFCYYKKENGGVSSARNLGIIIAKGEYITFIDSDDQYYPSYLASFETMLELYPECGHFWCAYRQYIDNTLVNDLSCLDDTDHFNKGETIAFTNNDDFSILSRDKIMNLHSRALDGSPCNKLYRTELIKELRMNEGLSLGEDMIFNWEYLDVNHNTDIVVNNQPQYWYYISGNQSLDHKYRPDYLEIVQILLDKMDYFLRKWDISEDQRALFFDSAFFRYEKVFKNVMRPENLVTRREKIAFINKIIRSSEFKTIINSKKCRLHPIYEFAYKTKNYKINLFCDKLVSIKKFFYNR